MLALAATLLALFTLSSAIADVIGLAENDGQPSQWIFLGFPLKKIDMYIGFVPVVIAIPLAILWALRAIKAKRFNHEKIGHLTRSISFGTRLRNGRSDAHRRKE